MESSTVTYKDQDGVEIFVYKWDPDGPPKAAVQIAHGLAEHAARYDEFAKFLTGAGYVCGRSSWTRQDRRRHEEPREAWAGRLGQHRKRLESADRHHQEG
jgi:hypothetical protein